MRCLRSSSRSGRLIEKRILDSFVGGGCDEDLLDESLGGLPILVVVHEVVDGLHELVFAGHFETLLADQLLVVDEVVDDVVFQIGHDVLLVLGEHDVLEGLDRALVLDQLGNVELVVESLNALQVHELLRESVLRMQFHFGAHPEERLHFVFQEIQQVLPRWVQEVVAVGDLVDNLLFVNVAFGWMVGCRGLVDCSVGEIGLPLVRSVGVPHQRDRRFVSSAAFRCCCWFILEQEQLADGFRVKHTFEDVAETNSESELDSCDQTSDLRNCIPQSQHLSFKNINVVVSSEYYACICAL